MRIVDSHTGGEPTRLVLSGGPDLGNGSLAAQRRVFAEHFDHIRTGIILEPKCPDSAVGALLCAPGDKDSAAGVIFFNTAGFLGMCGHGAIGVTVTLAYLGRIGLGKHKIATPVGVVDVDLIDPNTVRIENVESYCYRTDISIDVDGVGAVTGSVAWGGNWFFLVDNTPLALKPENIPALTDITWRIRRALAAENITGDAGEEIDHIELFEPIETGEANSRNFVLCPGGAYDRSPCGTGTSAKLACLAASGALAEGETWIQESIIGSRFEATYRYADDPSRIIPTLTGNAYVYSDATLIFDGNDPFRWGVG